MIDPITEYIIIKEGFRTGRGIARLAGREGGVDPGIVLAAMGTLAAIQISYKIYKTFLSQAAKACKQADNRSECREKYREKGNMERWKYLTNALKKCNKAKNPDKCREQISAIKIKVGKKILRRTHSI